MPKVIVIDAANRKFYEKEVSELKAYQELVGGYIEQAYYFLNGDCVVVNEEGLLQRPLPDHWFHVHGARQPFAGNGFIWGAADDEGKVTDCKTSLEEAEKLITFLNLEQIRRKYGTAE